MPAWTSTNKWLQKSSVSVKYYNNEEFAVLVRTTDLDKKDEAIDTLTNLLNKKPDYPEATIALGDLLIEKEDYYCLKMKKNLIDECILSFD